MVAQKRTELEQPLFVLPGITSDLELHAGKVVIRQHSFVSRFFPSLAREIVSIPLANIRDVLLRDIPIGGDGFYNHSLIRFTINTFDDHKYIIAYNRKHHPAACTIKAELDSALSRIQPFPPRQSIADVG